MGEQSRLDGRGLQELCPTMLQQLDAGACRARAQDQLGGDTSPRPTDAEGTMSQQLHLGFDLEAPAGHEPKALERKRQGFRLEVT